MSAEQLLRYVTDAGYLLIFGLTLLEALRRPSRASIDTCLLFGAAAGVIVASLLASAVGGEQPAVLLALEAAAIMALPYLLLRLVAEFPGIPSRLLRAAGIVWLATAASLFLVPQPYPAAYGLLLVTLFLAAGIYASWQFVAYAQRLHGVTRRRMQAAALGSVFMGAVIFVAGLAVLGGPEELWASLSSPLALASAVCYYVGFSTPGFLRRAWRAEEVRRFMTVTAGAPQSADAAWLSPRAAALIEDQIAAIVGASRVLLALWDEAQQRLVTMGSEALSGGPRAADRERTMTYRAFREQRGFFVADAARSDPANAEIYRELGVRSLLVTPISSGDRRMGVLVAYGRQSSLFANDDLSLLRVLASQIATFMVLHELLSHAAALQAREEAARLKEDFLSAAAHDLKTPLTTLLGHAQLMQRRLRRDPRWTPDPAPLDRMVEEALRLRRLVEDLLDASRSERGGFIATLDVLDLDALAREVVAQMSAPEHEFVVVGERATTTADRTRLRQVIQNLVENAVKYSPGGGNVTLEVWQKDGEARLSVHDEGVGIPPDDLPAIFERFQRGSRASDRRFAGMGVGLYLCKSIVEEHGGRIWAESSLGHGSQFHVALPASEREGV